MPTAIATKKTQHLLIAADLANNAMIDIFKAYATENGFKILGADSLIMLSTVVTGSVLKNIDYHWTVATSLITLYSLCYVIYTKSP